MWCAVMIIVMLKGNRKNLDFFCVLSHEKQVAYFKESTNAARLPYY